MVVVDLVTPHTRTCRAGTDASVGSGAIDLAAGQAAAVDVVGASNSGEIGWSR